MFSIIIPNYNSEKWIRKCLDSVLMQTYTNYELIIVDDMSTDNSVEIIKSYNDSRIKLIELDHKAYNGGTRNIGVANATKEYILFLDCDDWIYENMTLKKLHDFIRFNKTDLIRVSYVAYKTGEGKVRLREKTLEEMANTVFVAPWTKVIKRNLFVPFPENTLLEDVVQHIAQIDNIKTMSNSGILYAVWNRDNIEAISSDIARYTKDSKRYSSVYRNMADLLDLRCKHDYCEEQRQFRIKKYEEIIQRGDILGLINGGSRQ